MRNYEIVLMFDVNQDSLTEQTMDKYKNAISVKGGKVDRFEDWGNLKLAYEINKSKMQLVQIQPLKHPPPPPGTSIKYDPPRGLLGGYRGCMGMSQVFKRM